MTAKIKKNYTYEGLGFPIELHNIEMISINGKMAPKINVRQVADEAIKNLVLQETRITGNQIKFIRSYFSMSLREFGEFVNESHTAIAKWEKFKNLATNMDPNIEIQIRLFIFDKICVKTKHDKLKFYDNYLAINKILSKQNRRSLSQSAY